jgi:hypothetical protein
VGALLRFPDEQIVLSPPPTFSVSHLILFFFTCLAVYRVWRIVALDDFPPVASIRERLILFIHARHDARWGQGFISCSWCSGTWISFGGVGLVWWLYPGGLPLPGVWFLAVATVIGRMASRDK